MNDTIVYYAEKGDNRDQIFLTDSEGSFHTNLSDDSSHHNYAPSWLDAKTILYTRSPDLLMTTGMDGASHRQIDGIHATLARCFPGSMVLAFLDSNDRLILCDLTTKTSEVVIDAARLHTLSTEALSE